MTDDRELERLRAAEARLRAQVQSDDVSRRLAAIRHDIELALADIEDTIARTRAVRDGRGGGDGDGGGPPGRA